MSRSISRLEDLPNEILVQMCTYLDAQNLFRAFHHLNARLNQLLQSFQHLKLHLHIQPSNQLKLNEEIFACYVHTLIVNTWINFNLHHYLNVRRLKLHFPMPQVLAQLLPQAMPHLKHLSISYDFTMLEMDMLLERIFSNCFVQLRTCELLNHTDPMLIKTFSQSPAIQTLKVRLIDSTVYQNILSACPNLRSLQFSLHTKTSTATPTPHRLHAQLRQMSISLPKSDWFDEDNELLHQVLRAVPNLRKLTVHRISPFEELLAHDWLSGVLRAHLLNLGTFKYVMQYFSPGEVEEGSLLPMQRDFLHAHQGECVARLILSRESV